MRCIRGLQRLITQSVAKVDYILLFRLATGTYTYTLTLSTSEQIESLVTRTKLTSFCSALSHLTNITEPYTVHCFYKFTNATHNLWTPKTISSKFMSQFSIKIQNIMILIRIFIHFEWINYNKIWIHHTSIRTTYYVHKNSIICLIINSDFLLTDFVFFNCMTNAIYWFVLLVLFTKCDFLSINISTLDFIFRFV